MLASCPAHKVNQITAEPRKNESASRHTALITPGAVNIPQKRSLFQGYWLPHVVTDFVGHTVMVVKLLSPVYPTQPYGHVVFISRLTVCYGRAAAYPVLVSCTRCHTG